jgi:uncharacterized membrane protein
MTVKVESYVYDGCEVRLTGRQARKEVPRIKGEPMVFVLLEVTPIDDGAWLKWVKKEELFLID